MQQYSGRTLPPVAASYWFPTPPGSWPPGNGRASLVIYGGAVGYRCVNQDGGLLEDPVGFNYGCRALYSWLPLWSQRYGDRLAMTIVAQTRGRAVRSDVLSPAAEADRIQWFYREHLKLPVTVGVVVDAVHQLPGVDGRIFRRDTSFYGNLWGPSLRGWGSDLVVALYGAKGNLTYVGRHLEDPVLKQLIARELRTPFASRQEGRP
jgi:hypothetical protein